MNEGRVDHRAQEDAVEFVFPETGGTVSLTSGEPIDIQRESNADLELAVTLRLSEGASANIGMLCEGEDRCEAYQALPADLAGAGWSDIRISVSCFAAADLTRITSPFALSTDGAAEIAVSDVRLAEDEDGQETCLGQ